MHLYPQVNTIAVIDKHTVAVVLAVVVGHFTSNLIVDVILVAVVVDDAAVFRCYWRWELPRCFAHSHCYFVVVAVVVVAFLE